MKMAIKVDNKKALTWFPDDAEGYLLDEKRKTYAPIKFYDLQELMKAAMNRKVKMRCSAGENDGPETAKWSYYNDYFMVKMGNTYKNDFTFFTVRAHPMNAAGYLYVKPNARNSDYYREMRKEYRPYAYKGRIEIVKDW